jgi:predicted MFS family arabinose efflux permease
MYAGQALGSGVGGGLIKAQLWSALPYAGCALIAAALFLSRWIGKGRLFGTPKQTQSAQTQ